MSTEKKRILKNFAFLFFNSYIRFFHARFLQTNTQGSIVSLYLPKKSTSNSPSSRRETPFYIVRRKQLI